MFKNFKHIADLAGTIFGLIVMWDFAKAIARDEIRKEMAANNDVLNTTAPSKSSNVEPHVTMNHKDNTIHIRITR